MSRSILVTVLLVLSIPCMAAPYAVSTETFANVNWSVSGAAGVAYPADCNVISTSVTGAIASSGTFSIYGGFNCPAINGNFGVVGSGFVNTLGTISLHLIVSASNWNCTLNSTNLNGSCTISAGGVTTGTAILTAQ